MVHVLSPSLFRRLVDQIFLFLHLLRLILYHPISITPNEILMAMADHRKLIVVVGGTGKQGSSVVRTFLSQAKWQVRCLTRSPESPISLELQKLGAQITKADLNDRTNLNSAFDGASVIFANTDFWGPYSSISIGDGKLDEVAKSEQAYDTEVQQGRNIALAASEVSTLERFVYSSLAPAKSHSHGKYKHIYHWDSKAAILDFVYEHCPLLAAKMSLIYMGVYCDNSFLQPQRIGEDQFALVGPLSEEIKIPIIDPESSTGPFVRALVEDEAIGTKLLAYDSSITKNQVAVIWAEYLGQPVSQTTLSVEEMHQNFQILLEVLEAPAFINEFGFLGGVKNVIEPAQLQTPVHTTSFATWLSRARPQVGKT